jgi:hypothetical protein
MIFEPLHLLIPQPGISNKNYVLHSGISFLRLVWDMTPKHSPHER